MTGSGTGDVTERKGEDHIPIKKIDSETYKSRRRRRRLTTVLGATTLALSGIFMSSAPANAAIDDLQNELSGKCIDLDPGNRLNGVRPYI